MSDFKVEDGLKYQLEDFENWAKVLNPIALEKLRIEIGRRNNLLNNLKSTGHSVFRGSDIAQFIYNLRNTL